MMLAPHVNLQTEITPIPNVQVTIPSPPPPHEAPAWVIPATSFAIGLILATAVAVFLPKIAAGVRAARAKARNEASTLEGAAKLWLTIQQRVSVLEVTVRQHAEILDAHTAAIKGNPT